MPGKVGREGLPALGEGSLMRASRGTERTKSGGRLLAVLGGLVKARISARPVAVDKDAREPRCGGRRAA